MGVGVIGGPLGPQQRGADLWAVAVRHDDVEAQADDLDDLLGRPSRIGELLGDGPLLTRTDEGVATDGDHRGLHHGRPTDSARAGSASHAWHAPG